MITRNIRRRYQLAFPSSISQSRTDPYCKVAKPAVAFWQGTRSLAYHAKDFSLMTQQHSSESYTKCSQHPLYFAEDPVTAYGFLVFKLYTTASLPLILTGVVSSFFCLFATIASPSPLLSPSMTNAERERPYTAPESRPKLHVRRSSPREAA